MFRTLSLEERVAQLFMVAAYSNHSEKHQNEISALVRDHKVGGIVFFQGGPVHQAQLTNYYQSISDVPLIIGQDVEYGFAMRLDSCHAFPQQLTLGAIQKDSLLYEMAEEIADQSHRLGVHVNFGPVVDVNINRDNPVINERSYGEIVSEVTAKGLAFMQGLQDNGIIATAKHFPGHGDTESDSHKTLPIVPFDRERLDSVELAPFQALINAGLSGVMTAHLYVPSLDTTSNLASTLSYSIMTDLLQDQMGFEGLLFSDALNMRGVNAFYDPGEVEVQALLAGNDVLLLSENVPLAIQSIVQAIKDGRLSEEQINRSCLKILRAKEFVHLDAYAPIPIEGLVEEMNPYSSELLQRTLIEESLTLLNNSDDILPLKRLDTLSIATLAVGSNPKNDFYASLSRYAPITPYSINQHPGRDEILATVDSLKQHNLIIISAHGMNDKPFDNFGLDQDIGHLIGELRSAGIRVILDLFGNPYSLGGLIDAHRVDAIVVSYEENALSMDLSGQLIFGGIPAQGKLPVSASRHFLAGDGIIQNGAVRFKYTIPEELGINPLDLERIDQLAYEGIRDGAYPGCQILVAKDGKIFYQESFGYHTYSNDREVLNTDIYDLASITKIASSTASIMKLQSEGYMDVDHSLCDYIPEVVGEYSEYGHIKLREMLAHQAGLVSWIPFYISTIHQGEPSFKWYSLFQSEHYSQRVADDLYILESARDSMLASIVDTPLGSKKYKYSDLGYYFIMEIVEKLTQTTLDTFTHESFYAPLGLQTMTYKPRDSHPLDVIVPTEDDQIFRGQLVHGDVHDPGSAMMGGVGGHAGLFSNANDLAVMMQMFLNWGEYGGERYLDADIVQDFTTTQYASNSNRRGVGFDKPVTGGGAGPTCSCVSYDSFGHSGFTGTIAWADPDEEVVYIFLSNRIYPSAENRKLITSGIRTRIQDAIYDAIDNITIEQ